MKNAKKIGIITFSNTLDNYGQVLQYLATQIYLEERNHEVYLYLPPKYRPSIINIIKRKIKNIIKKIVLCFFYNSELSKRIITTKTSTLHTLEEQKRNLFQKWEKLSISSEQNHPRFFEQFREKYFHVLSCSYFDLCDFYAFAVGSDQTWSYISKETMLDFGPKDMKRFSIAPSLGHKVFSDEEILYASSLLDRFDLITVREQNGKEFCSACGRDDAQVVLDPTFLLSSSQYDKFVNEQGLMISKPYIFLYLLGGEIEVRVEDIYEWAQSNDLEVIYVASQGREDSFPKCYATIEQWLTLIKNAKYVFTNSFHGVALSTIYRVPFLIFPLVGIMQGMNGRILHFSSEFNMTDRIYVDTLDVVKNDINWKYVNDKISKNFVLMDKLLSTINL